MHSTNVTMYKIPEEGSSLETANCIFVISGREDTMFLCVLDYNTDTSNVSTRTLMRPCLSVRH